MVMFGKQISFIFHLLTASGNLAARATLVRGININNDHEQQRNLLICTATQKKQCPDETCVWSQGECKPRQTTTTDVPTSSPTTQPTSPPTIAGAGSCSDGTGQCLTVDQCVCGGASSPPLVRHLQTSICDDIKKKNKCTNAPNCAWDRSTGCQSTVTSSESPSKSPTTAPTDAPTPCSCDGVASPDPTTSPSKSPTNAPTTANPSREPSKTPSSSPTSPDPTTSPSKSPTNAPTTTNPSKEPSKTPSSSPTSPDPTTSPSKSPTNAPTTANPSKTPSKTPSSSPTLTNSPTPPNICELPATPAGTPCGNTRLGNCNKAVCNDGECVLDVVDESFVRGCLCGFCVEECDTENPIGCSSNCQYDAVDYAIRPKPASLLLSAPCEYEYLTVEVGYGGPLFNVTRGDDGYFNVTNEPCIEASEDYCFRLPPILRFPDFEVPEDAPRLFVEIETSCALEVYLGQTYGLLDDLIIAGYCSYIGNKLFGCGFLDAEDPYQCSE